MPTGVGGLVYISDESENVTKVSTAGRVFASDSYQRIKTHSPINVTAASGGSEFQTVEVGRVYLRSESGNDVMWWGGTSDDAPYSGHGFPLYGGETSIPIHVTNFNAVRICASVSGQIVYPIGFLNGTDIILPNEVPQAPPVAPDTTAPLVISHSPVSGFSGVALNSEVSVTFNEEIVEASVASGSFVLSPAHNVTVFRDVAVVEKIVMTPNQNLSGSTVYYVGVTSAITDLAGNSVSGTATAPFVFPFTTDAAPPPPDTTPPWVSGTVPVSGATNVSAGTNVTITFSEAMLSGTIHAQNIYLSYLSGQVVTSGISGVVTLAVDQHTATIDPTPTFLSGNTVIHVNILSGCQDLAGNGLSGGHDRRRVFTTGTLDLTNPVVSGTVPANGATNVSVSQTVVVTFSENMLSGTINTTNLYLSTTSGGTANPTAGNYTVTLSGNQKAAAINPSADLDGGQQYYINVLDAVTDLAGNNLSGTAGDKGRNFTTVFNFTEIYNVTGSNSSDMFGGDTERMGEAINSSSSALIGETLKRMTFRLRKSGSPSGTIFARIWNSSFVEKADFGEMQASDLTTSFADYVFTNTSNTYVLANGDRIGIEYTGTSAVDMRRLASDGFDGTASCLFRDSGEITGEDVHGILYT